MKHIKRFENLIDNIIFAVDIRGINKEQFDKLKTKILTDDNIKKIYFDFDQLLREIVLPQAKFLIPWALVFSIDNYNNLSITRIVTPGWGAGYEYMEAIIPLNIFLEKSFTETIEYVDKIKDEIEMKKQANKYNL